ncbi:MAG: thiolase family protein [Desulfomonilaceae bacterium]|nr:thiolase family protein [Desulfomonilaceae bacterium]
MTQTHEEIVIVSAVRTPFGRYGGALRDMDYYDLGAIPIREVLARVPVDDLRVDEVYWGVGDTAACKDVYTPVAARQTLMKAGLPVSTPSVALDKACVSAMSAVHYACRAMKAGEIQTAVAGGATSFSQMPLVVRGLRFSGFRIGSVEMEDPLFALGYKDFAPVAVDAGNTAVQMGISREDQDAWALRSHENYAAAYGAGKFDEEIMSIELPQKKGDPVLFSRDEQFRSNISMERLSQLKTVYGSPTVTAGNAPGLNDGATAVLLMTRRKADELGLDPLCRITAMSSIAIEPHRLAEAPAFAIKDVLRKADLSLDDITVMEINEAFAAVPLVSTKLLADGDRSKWEKIKSKTNVNGSAIAIGHPNTASGARVIMNLLYELRRRGGGLAAGAICGGLAQADAVVLRV